MVKVVMREASWNLEAGQTVDVEQEHAEQLVADGHASYPEEGGAASAKKKG